MGAEPFLITSTLVAAIAQRLLRTICPDCKEPVNLTSNLLAQLGISSGDIHGVQFYRGQGCAACNKTGYRGRTAVFEVLEITDPIRELILEKAPTTVIKRRARELGMRSLREEALLKLYDGLTTFEEIVRET
jgi:type IV pilus assembly protein PilB